MPTIQEINELNLKIAAAKTERDALDYSINGSGVTGGNWKESLQKNCSVSWEPNKAAPPISSTFVKNGAIDCPAIWNLITARTKKIAEDDANILLWQGQVNALMKDPQVIQDLKDQETARKLRRNIITVVVVVILIIVGIFIYRKYKK